jgi:hypothetical protein
VETGIVELDRDNQLRDSGGSPFGALMRARLNDGCEH